MALGVLIYAGNISGSIARECAKSINYNKEESVSGTKIFLFALPLILSGMLSMIVPNVTNSALALAQNAEKAIAAYSITMIVSNFVCAMSANLQFIIINHNSLQKENERKIRIFVIGIGAAGAAFLALAAFSAFGDFILSDMLNALADTTLVAKTALVFVILNPLFTTYATYYYGYLLKIRKTKMLIFQRLISGIVPYALYLLIPIVPWHYAAGLGAAAVTLGNLAVGVYNHLVFKFAYRKHTALISENRNNP